MKKSKNILDYIAAIIPGAVSGLLFLIFLFGGLNFFISLGIGLASFISLSLVFSKKKKEIEFQIDGISKETYDEYLKNFYLKSDYIKNYENQIKNEKIKNQIHDISLIIDKIIKDIEKDPKDIKIARQYLNYYLESTTHIIEKYINLYNSQSKSTQVNKTLQKVESLLTVLKSAYETLFEKLLNDDLLNLDTELEVLEKTIKSEGMSG